MPTKCTPDSGNQHSHIKPGCAMTEASDPGKSQTFLSAFLSPLPLSKMKELPSERPRQPFSPFLNAQPYNTQDVKRPYKNSRFMQRVLHFKVEIWRGPLDPRPDYQSGKIFTKISALWLAEICKSGKVVIPGCTQSPINLGSFYAKTYIKGVYVNAIKIKRYRADFILCKIHFL